MSLFTNPYSAIITKGLGTTACCSIITMDFSLFSCTVEVSPIPPEYYNGGAGGGPYPTSGPRPVITTPNYLTPVNGHIPFATQHVTVTISVNGQPKSSKHYVVSRTKANFVVKVANITSKALSGVNVVVESVKRAFRNVIVRIRNK